MAAQKRMGILLCGGSVIDAQCFFLAGVYLMATLRPIEAWKLFVQALACCQGFSVNHYTYGACLENEWNLKQRIYWTCFKSELYVTPRTPWNSPPLPREKSPEKR